MKARLLLMLAIVMSLPLAASAATAADEPSVLVKTEPLRKQTVSETLTVYGTVMPATGAAENVSLPRPVQVARLLVSPGQVVKRGEPLLELSTDATATAAYRQAESAETFAQGELKRMGWMEFRKIYEATLKEILSGKYPGQSLQPILNALGKEVFDRFMESVNDNPNSVIGQGIEKEQYDLLMSPFHNIDYRKKLLGKKESERDYNEMRAKSMGLVANFVQRAVQKKNLKIRKQKQVPQHDNIKSGTQMKLKI